MDNFLKIIPIKCNNYSHILYPIKRYLSLLKIIMFSLTLRVSLLGSVWSFGLKFIKKHIL